MMRRYGVYFVIVSFVVLCLSAGCSGILDPGIAPVRMQWTPRLLSTQKPQHAFPLQLLVSRPTASVAIDNDFIALLFHDREIRYLAGVRWENNVLAMLQEALKDQFEDMQVFNAVGGERDSISADIKLSTDIRQFVLRYAAEDAVPVAEFVAYFRLIETLSGESLGGLPVQIQVPAAGKDATSLVIACESAVYQALNIVGPWVVSAVAKKSTMVKRQ